MTPESVALIIIALFGFTGATLLLFGGWLIRHDLSRNPSTRPPRLIENLRPFQHLIVDYFARTEPGARLLNVLAAYPYPIAIGAALRWAQPAAGRIRSANVPHLVSEWVGLWMMRLGSLIKMKKRAVWMTDAGFEVQRRITTPPPSLEEQKPRGKSIYDSLFIPLPIDNSGSGHLQRVRAALRSNEPNFLEQASPARLTGLGELRPTKLPTQPTDLQTIQTTPMNKRTITMTAADHEELTYAIAAAGKLSERGRTEMSALKAELARAEIVEAKDLPSDVITMNSRAELLDLDSGERMEFTVVFPRDADIEVRKISVLAPLGTAMLGYRVGDEFTWTVPYGVRRLKVIAVHFQPEAHIKKAA